MAPLNLDAAESIFFDRELQSLKTRTYERLLPAQKSRQFIPTDEGIPSGAMSFRWQEFDEVGKAKIIASYADDLPMVEVEGTEHVGKIRSIGVGYGYSLQEVRAAAFAGTPLNERRAMAARTADELLIDEILAVGDADNDLPGFLNASSVPVYDAINGTAGTTPWSTKTAAEIRDDINTIVAATIDATNGVEVGPFDLLLPPEQFTLVAQMQNSTSSDVTIMEFLLSANPFIRSIDSWHRLKLAATGGSLDRGMIYTRDPGKVEAIVPQEFEQLEPQQTNLAWKVPTHARVGGTIFHFPLSARYIDKI